MRLDDLDLEGALQMNSYFVVSPRDFANEYSVYVVPKPLVSKFLDLFPTAERTTRQGARFWGWTRPRDAKRYGEQWYGGYATWWGESESSDQKCRASSARLVKWLVANGRTSQFD